MKLTNASPSRLQRLALVVSLAVGLLAAAPLALAQNPLHGHYVLVSTALDSYSLTGTSSQYTTTDDHSFGLGTMTMNLAVRTTKAQCATGQGSSGTVSADMVIQVKVKWVPDAGETGHPVGQDAQWSVYQKREGNMIGFPIVGPMSDYGGSVAPVMGLPYSVDPNGAGFNARLTTPNPQSLDTVEGTVHGVTMGGFDFALVNGDWIGTGNFDVTPQIQHSFSAIGALDASGSPEKPGVYLRLNWTQTLESVGGLPIQNN